MRKQLLLLAVGGLLITGCSQVEKENVDQGKEQAIAFRTTMGKSTRGTEIDNTNLNSIKVHALGALSYEDIYTGIANGSGLWISSYKHFWPASGTVKFHAYAPSSLASAGTVAINSSVQKITGFSPKTTILEQEDLVVAYSEGDKTTNATSGVSLNFKHALSQIVVKAKNGNSDIKVDVKAVKLGSINSKADFAFPVVETSTAYVLPKTNWTNWITPIDYTTSIASSAVTLDGSAQDIMNGNGGMMLIPQTLTKWETTSPTNGGAYIAVLCRISDVNAIGGVHQLYPDPSISGNNGNFAYAAVGITPDWEPGKKYIYTLDFSNGYGNIPPNQDPGGTPTPTPGGPGDPILDTQIKLTVTVSDWTDENKPITL